MFRCDFKWVINELKNREYSFSDAVGGDFTNAIERGQGLTLMANESDSFIDVNVLLIVSDTSCYFLVIERDRLECACVASELLLSDCRMEAV